MAEPIIFPPILRMREALRTGLDSLQRLGRVLPNHLLNREIRSLSHSLEDIMRDPRRIRELGERRLGEIAERTERLEVELKDLLEKNKGKPELRLVSEEIKRSLRELAPLANILARENDRRENLPELRTVLATNNPFQVNELLVSADKPALGQAADAARIEQFSLEKTLNFSPLSGTEARGDVTVRSLMQAMIETLSIEATDRLSELLARVLSSMVTDRTVKAIERAVERSGELTENEIERAIAEINDELAELSSRTSTYRQPLVLRERIQGAELLKTNRSKPSKRKKPMGPKGSPTALSTIGWERSFVSRSRADRPCGSWPTHLRQQCLALKRRRPPASLISCQLFSITRWP